MGKCAIFDDEQVVDFEYDEDTNVQLAFLTKEAAAELSKEVDKIVNRTGADWSQVWNQKLGERVVRGWYNRLPGMEGHPGLVMPDGTPIPYSPENRDMQMKRNREFSLFVGNNTTNATEYLTALKKRIQAKNS